MRFIATAILLVLSFTTNAAPCSGSGPITTYLSSGLPFPPGVTEALISGGLYQGGSTLKLLDAQTVGAPAVGSTITWANGDDTGLAGFCDLTIPGAVATVEPVAAPQPQIVSVWSPVPRTPISSASSCKNPVHPNSTAAAKTTTIAVYWSASSVINDTLADAVPVLLVTEDVTYKVERLNKFKAGTKGPCLFRDGYPQTIFTQSHAINTDIINPFTWGLTSITVSFINNRDAVLNVPAGVVLRDINGIDLIPDANGDVAGPAGTYTATVTTDVQPGSFVIGVK